MTFRVRWRDAALNDLADAWLRAEPAQRADINRAAYAIEQELKMQPHEKGVHPETAYLSPLAGQRWIF